MANKDNHPLFPLQPQTRKAFAAHLGISYDTLKRRAEKLDIKLPKRILLTPDLQRTLLQGLEYQTLLDKYD